jgi:hypothetical protein
MFELICSSLRSVYHMNGAVARGFAHSETIPRKEGFPMNRLLFLGSALFLIGCARSLDPLDQIAYGPGKHPDSFKYLLGSEPPEATNVIALRSNAKDGDPIVVVGRVGGSKHPVVKGRAAFTIVDLSLRPCNEEDVDCFDFA